MKRIIYIWCLFCIPWHPIEGQNLQVSGSKIEIPSGGIVGAAFYEDKGMFFVQQSVSWTDPEENDKRNTYPHRRLSSWNLASHAMITKRSIAESPSRPGGRVQVSTITHRLYICNAESGLDIMDPDTLATAGTMAHVDGQIIIDFAVDDLNRRAVVLSAQKDQSILLTSYSLLTGAKQQETALPAINYLTGGRVPPDLVSVSRSGQIGVYLEDKSGSSIKNNSGIYICKDAPNLACDSVSDADATTSVSEMSFLGQNVLAASSKFADDRWLCIMSVSPGYRYSIKKPFSLGMSFKYCDHSISFYNSRGVHYAVAVVEDKYVVGFTGVDKQSYVNGYMSISTSFSIWRAGTSKLAAIVKIPTDHGNQSAFRIVGSNTKAMFIAYHGMSNTLYLYSITEN